MPGMRTPMMLLGWVALACAQDEIGAVLKAAEEAAREIGADAAEPHWARLEVMLPHLAPDSPRHASVAGMLGNGLVNAGQDVRAFRIMDEALARMSHLPDGHPSMLRLLDWKASAFRNSRRYREAAEVRARIAAADSASDSNTARKAKYDLASAYQMAGLHEKAIPILRELGSFPPGRLTSDASGLLAESLIELRRFAEAEPLLRSLIAQAKTAQEKDSWQMTLARMLFREGRIGEAKDLGYDGRDPQIIACGFGDVAEELGIRDLLSNGVPRAGSIGAIAMRLHGHLASCAELAGYARLRRIDDVASMARQFSGSQPGALGPLIESAASELERAHLFGGPYRVDYIWADLIQAARTERLTSTAERLALRQIELIEKHRGKDSPSLDRPKATLAAIRRGAPVP